MASKAFATREQRLQQALLARPAADTDAASDGRACERCQPAAAASGEASEHGDAVDQEDAENISTVNYKYHI
jgi:hypothetical protein